MAVNSPVINKDWSHCAQWCDAPPTAVPREWSSVFSPLLKLESGEYIIDECRGQRGLQWKILTPIPGVKDADLLRLFRATKFDLDLASVAERVSACL